MTYLWIYARVSAGAIGLLLFWCWLAKRPSGLGDGNHVGKSE